MTDRADPRTTTDDPRPSTTDHRHRARLNPPVFYGSAIGVTVIAIWAIVAPAAASETIGTLVEWTSEWFGWFYILFATGALVFVAYLALSRYGRMRLGPAHSTPEYGTFAWVSMLFAAGIGTDLMFFAVAGPVSHYLDPPVGEGQSIEAAREATVWTLFHYGISGWGMYALMGLALAYFAYRMNLPLAIRSALFPVFGRRVRGVLGHSVDIAAVLGTIFGVATSLGIAVVQLNFGLDVLFGIPESRVAQIGLLSLAAVIATLSAVSGVRRGIRLLATLSVVLAMVLLVFVLLTEDTVFLLNGLVLNLGDYVSSFPQLALETFAFDRPVEWLNNWTLFFWAWWVAWASFVGLFLARISRGRTIRQFVAGTIILPFSYVLIWVSVFGNSAIEVIRQGNAAFGDLAVNQPERGFYTLLMEYPGFAFVGGLATLVGLLFYVTSADSAALVMANLSSRLPTPQTDARSGVRVFWAVATGVLTAAMLVVGGVPALQSATVIMGLPFAFVMVLIMVGLYRALHAEGRRADARAPGDGLVPAASRDGAHPAGDGSHEFLDEVAHPALLEVAEELRSRGVPARTRRNGHDGIASLELVADLPDAEPFRYEVRSGHGATGLTHCEVVDDALGQFDKERETAR